MEVVSPRVRYLFRRCLREGIYPRTWRTARLFLLRKERRSPDSPSVYRPICLLDEIGKLFESVIAACLEAHISERVPGWHDSQYGFRRVHATVDAVTRVRSMADDMVFRYGVALAVSLDVSNAFKDMGEDNLGSAALRGAGVPSRGHRSLPERQVDHLRREERGREKMRGARRPAGFGAGADLVDHGLRHRPSVPDAHGHGPRRLCRRYLGASRRTVVKETVILTEDAVACAVHAILRQGLSVCRPSRMPCGSSITAGGDPLPTDCP
jgi:hypothetical protein